MEATATPTGYESPLTAQAFVILKELTDNYSPRESLTEEEVEASRHLLTRLKQLGYATSVQEFDVTLHRARMEASSQDFDVRDPLDVFTARPSPEGVVTGQLIDVGRALDAGSTLEAGIPDEGLSERIALIERGGITLDEKVKRVTEAGAVGAVIFNNHRGMFYGNLNSESSIPVLTIRQEYGRTLKDLAGQGEVQVTISSGDETTKSRNVIAYKRSALGIDRTVIIGAHYDTVADTQGASDNGSGLATVLTIAKHVAAHDYPFNVRIVLFGAEEVGLHGSYHYADNMGLKDFDNTIAMMNFDAFGSGTKLGITGDDDLVDVAKQIGAEKDIPLFHRVRPSLGRRSRSFPPRRHPCVPGTLKRPGSHKLA